MYFFSAILKLAWVANTFLTVSQCIAITNLEQKRTPNMGSSPIVGRASHEPRSSTQTLSHLSIRTINEDDWDAREDFPLLGNPEEMPWWEYSDVPDTRVYCPGRLNVPAALHHGQTSITDRTRVVSEPESLLQDICAPIRGDSGAGCRCKHPLVSPEVICGGNNDLTMQPVALEWACQLNCYCKVYRPIKLPKMGRRIRPVTVGASQDSALENSRRRHPYGGNPTQTSNVALDRSLSRIRGSQPKDLPPWNFASHIGRVSGELL